MSRMQSFPDLARALNRPPVYLRGLQTRFALPELAGAKSWMLTRLCFDP